jgi:hypothetical protein
MVNHGKTMVNHASIMVNHGKRFSIYYVSGNMLAKCL